MIGKGLRFKANGAKTRTRSLAPCNLITIITIYICERRRNFYMESKVQSWSKIRRPCTNGITYIRQPSRTEEVPVRCVDFRFLRCFMHKYASVCIITLHHTFIANYYLLSFEKLFRGVFSSLFDH